MARRAGLDTEAVIATGATLADEVGLDGLSISLLAARLGIRAPSLYNHITGLEGLRRALALRGIEELGTRLAHAAVGKAGDEALLALAHAYRAFVNAHPGLYAATQLAPPADDTVWRDASAAVVTIVLAALTGYNRTGDEALHLVRGLRSLLHGFATLEASGGFGLPLDLDESYERVLRTFIAGIHATS